MIKRALSLTTICMSFIFLLGSFSVRADQETAQFLVNELNRNFDNNVRTEIIKTLGDYNNFEEAKSELLNILGSTFNSDQLRIEAARSLSTLANDTQVTQAIIRAHDNSRDVNFRASMLECLYLRAPKNAQVRNVLLKNLQQSHHIKIQEASAFALMNTLDNDSIRLSLIQLVENSFKPLPTRMAIVKALYHGRNYPEVRTALEGIALDGSQDVNLRASATRIMSVFPKGRGLRNALFNLVSNSQHASLRSQAARGLKFKMTEEDIQWLRLPIDPRSGLSRYPF